jgi:N-methylhydantoinase A/oxoprolinase/acetone carboxylase beta subunit
VLGVLRPEAFLGGRIGIDAAAAREAMRPLAVALGIEPDDVAERIRGTVHEQMGRLLAQIVRERGVEPASATVLAFGGNGATHAAGIAEHAGIRDVLVVPFAPVFSAFGASTATVRHVREWPASEGGADALRMLVLRDLRSEGFAEREVRLAVQEVERDGEAWLVAEGVRDPRDPDITRSAADRHEAHAVGETTVRWPGHGSMATRLYTPEALAPGATLTGPALVEAAETTCAVPPGWSASIDGLGTLCLNHEEGVHETR